MRAAYWDKADSGADVTGNAISASWGGKTGINLTGAFSGEDSAGDPSNIYLKLGLKTGDGSAYAVDYSETTDKGLGDANSISVAWVKNVMKGVEVYASYRIESLDNVAGADDITAFIGGARVKF